MKTLIVGAGKTGLSMARFLRRDGGCVSAVDTRRRPPCAAAMRELLGDENCMFGHDFRRWSAEFAKFDCVCASPGVPPSWLKTARQHTRVKGEVSLLPKPRAGMPVRVWITGTNGKSTVTALVVALCRAAGMTAEPVGNFGVPLLDAWREWEYSQTAPYDFSPKQYPPAVAVAELSSFQLQYCGAADIRRGGGSAAAVLNVSADHLDYHEDMREYAAAKMNIYRLADYGVINLDDPMTARAHAGRDKSRMITFSVRQNADWRLRSDYIVGGGMRFRRDQISPALSVENVLSALALFSALVKTKIKPDIRKALTEAIARFPGLPHRRRVVGRFGGVNYINDSKSTNTAAARFALQNTSGKIVLIAGGDGKGQDFSPLASACQTVKKAFLLGKDAATVGRALKTGGVESEIVADMKTAVVKATKTARRGDTVLLSPACSSLDMYQDYAARGDDFAAEVENHAR